METIIREIEPDQDSLACHAFEKIDYKDAFLISFEKNTFQSIDLFSKLYFLSQPAWLRAISMNTFSKKAIASKMEQEFKTGDQIGSWRIFERNENEIVFGESMGFMDYRFSMKLEKKEHDDIVVSTVVKLNGSMGKYYFALVKLLHKKFVKLSLKHAIGAFNETA